jgi:hypothetical protein
MFDARSTKSRNSTFVSNVIRPATERLFLNSAAYVGARSSQPATAISSSVIPGRIVKWSQKTRRR